MPAMDQAIETMADATALAVRLRRSPPDSARRLLRVAAEGVRVRESTSRIRGASVAAEVAGQVATFLETEACQ